LSEKLKKIITKEKITAVLKEIVTTENVAVKSEESQENEAPKVEETPKVEENRQDEIATSPTLDREDSIKFEILNKGNIDPNAVIELIKLEPGDTDTLKRIVNQYKLYDSELVDAMSRAFGSSLNGLIEDWQKEAEKDQGMEQ
jgi:hypothetical protein